MQTQSSTSEECLGEIESDDSAMSNSDVIQNSNGRVYEGAICASSGTLLLMMASEMIVHMLLLAGKVQNNRIAKKMKRVRRGSIQRHRDKCHLYLSPREFERAFRLTREAFFQLLQVLQLRLERDEEMAARSSGGSVEPDIRLALTLRMLSGGSYHDLMMLFRIGRSTAYDVFAATIDAILEVMFLPGVPLQDANALHSLAQGFTTSRVNISLIWGCVGAIDGIAIKTLRPPERFNPHSYFCRKGYFAIPVQAVVDSSYKFLYMSARAVGSTRDSLAFGVSDLSHSLAAGELMQGYWIAGDPAFECKNGIITPYTESLIQDAELGVARDGFIYLQSSLRTHVEQAFGMLVARFGVLWRPMRHSLPRVPRVIGACMQIHNFCIDNNYPCIERIMSAEERDACDDAFQNWWEAATYIRDNVEQGRRRELEESELRDILTEKLRQVGFFRPV